MARLRVSSRTVWRRAGGRRGPEPALALDSAELGLSWEDADAPAADPQPPATVSVPVRRRYAAAVYALSLAFVPLVVATVTATAPAEQGSDVARAGETRQYHAVTGPVLVPAVVGETLTIDKWKGTQPDRLQPRPYRTQHTGTAPIVVPDVTTPAPVLSWAGTFPASQRLPARSLPLGGTVLVTPQAPPSVDLSWLPQEAPLHRRPALVGGQAWVAPLSVPDVTQPAPALSWRAVGPDRVWGRARVAAFPQPAAPVAVPDVTAPVVPLSWRPIAPDRLARPSRPASQTVAPIVVPDVTQPVPPLSWAARLSEVQRLARRGPIAGVVAPVVTPAPATPVDLDWWQAATLAPRTPARRLTLGSVGPVAPVVVAVTPPVLPALSGRPPARAGWRLHSEAVAPLYVPDVTTPAPVLAWQRQAPDPARRAVRRPATLLAAPVGVPTGTVDVLSWHVPAPGRVGGRRTDAARTDLIGPVFVPAPATPQGWQGYAATPVRRAQRPLGVVIVPLEVGVVPVPSVAGWLPILPAPPVRRVWHRPVWVDAGLDRTTAPGVFGPCEMWQMPVGVYTFPLAPETLTWVVLPKATVYTFDQPESLLWVFLPGTQDFGEW